MLYPILLLQMEMAEITYLILFGSITFVVFLVFIVAVALRYYKRNHQYHQKILVMEIGKKQEILNAQIEIQEQIFTSISRELHDNLGQISSLIKINLNTIRLDDVPRATEKLEVSKELLRQLITDIKLLSVSLGNDRIAQLGLLKVMETEVERLSKSGEFSINYEVTGTLPALDSHRSLILYRMVQEILNNIIKHSSARQIDIIITIEENTLILILQDDGVGFNVEEKKLSGGAGLKNLQNRAQVIDAEISFQSSPGKGTRIKIELNI